jgi:hypothetical protein
MRHDTEHTPGTLGSQAGEDSTRRRDGLDADGRPVETEVVDGEVVREEVSTATAPVQPADQPADEMQDHPADLPPGAQLQPGDASFGANNAVLDEAVHGTDATQHGHEPLPTPAEEAEIPVDRPEAHQEYPQAGYPAEPVSEPVSETDETLYEPDPVAGPEMRDDGGTEPRVADVPADASPVTPDELAHGDAATDTATDGQGTVYGSAAAATGVAAGGAANAAGYDTGRPATDRAGSDSTDSAGGILTGEDELRQRWDAIQLRFVDDPAAVAAEARALMTEALDDLRGSIDNEPEGETDTEALRQQVARYREIFLTLVSAR